MISVYDLIMADNSISEEQKRKETEYKQYVDEHVNNVNKAWEEMKNKNMIIDFICAESQTSRSILLPTVDALILSHDRSKYGADEWEPYRIHFYSVNNIEKQSSEAEFERAWEHHYTCNMHHPEHWKDNLDKMPMIYIVEMCCDWIAMSMKFGGNAYEWYHKNGLVEFKFSETQKEWLEFILKNFYK